ncbi:MAG: PucR family transcriptional regulator [Mycobacteriales bacterium]
MPTDSRRQLLEVLEGRLEALTQLGIERLRVGVPGYAVLSEEQLRPGIEGDLRRAIRALSQRRGPSPPEMAAAEDVGSHRARQGVPLDAMLQGFQLLGRLVWTELRGIAGTVGAPSHVLVELAEDVWAWLDLVIPRAAESHRRFDLQRARSDEQHRVMLIHALLHGTLAAGEARTALLGLGLRPDRLHVAFRGRAGAGALPSDLVNRIARPWGGERRAAIVEGVDIVGICEPEHMPDDTRLTVGFGPATNPVDASESFAAAGRACDAAVAFGLTGRHSLRSLGLRAVVVAENYVGDELVVRMRAPLEATRGLAAQLEESVRTLFASRRNVEEAARRLVIHPNTLRYRLRKFGELTGFDLDEVDDLVAVWWALQRVRVQGRQPESSNERPDTVARPL